MAEVEWWEFDSAAEMAEQVAGDIAFVIESARGARWRAARDSGDRKRSSIHRCWAPVEWAQMN